MEQFTLEATVREERGKNAARRLRQSGKVPAVVYGGKEGPLAVTISTKQVTSILRSESGRNTIFTLQVAGAGEKKAIVKDLKVDPVKGTLLHVDLMRVAMDVRMRVRVPVHTFGEPAGVKLQEGVFEIVTREVEIECLPADIPDEYRLDVSELVIGKHLRISDLPIDPQKIRLVTDPQRVIAHVVAPHKEEEVVAPEAAVAAEAAPAEPEVIKKGKKEEEGEGEEGEVEVEEKKEKKEKK